MITLRPYQQEAIDALYTYFSGSDGNPLIVMPTGTGKSVVIGCFLRHAFEGWSDSRILVLTHVKELISQNHAALLNVWPLAPAGIYSAGLNRRDIKAQILFAGIQSIHKRAFDVQRCDLVIIDEAHLLGKKDSGMYRSFIKDLLIINPSLKIIGFTATPYRMDSGLLHEGEGRLFTDIAYELPILRMIEMGYLAPVTAKSTGTQLDVSNVTLKAGEFNARELEAAVDQDPINKAAVAEIVQRGADRGSWLIFCSGVDHAIHIRDEIRRHGITCETVLGDTPSIDRARILTNFKAGRIRALTNANVLTTGFDAPGTDLIALLRPTKSTGLYVQMVGRGTRIANGKEDCLVLDFAGNTKRHGQLDTIDGRRRNPSGKDGDAPIKTCPTCQSIVAAASRQCPDCGHEFPPPTTEIEKSASTLALLSTQIRPEWTDVSSITYAAHAKPEKPTSLRVDYRCGLVTHSEWVCLEHTGYPREKACSWWVRRAPRTNVPKTVAEALSRTAELAEPLQIEIKPQGRFIEILRANFS